MILLDCITIFALAAACANALPLSGGTTNSSRPLVIWHGLGDSHSSPGMLKFMSLVSGIHPGIFIHSIFIEEDLGQDRKAGYLGNVNDQVAAVSEQLAAIPELAAHGFDAIGFSQGGQFLRAYVERYNDPPVHNLITFGSQHMGVSDLPGCTPSDLLCRLVMSIVSSGVYTEWTQNNIVPAQFFRDPSQMSTYLSANHFLTDINNEISTSRNTTYSQNLRSLANLVLVLFTEDKTVIPKESSWFGSWAPPDEKNLTTDEGLISMREQPLYREDWIGLKALDDSGRVTMLSCDGAHMHLSQECWEPIVQKYVGGSWEGARNGAQFGLVVQAQ